MTAFRIIVPTVVAALLAGVVLYMLYGLPRAKNKASSSSVASITAATSGRSSALESTCLDDPH